MLKFPCPECGTPNAYEDFECGTEKYCISCQRLVTVPAGDAVASPAVPPAVVSPAAAAPIAAAPPPVVQQTATPRAQAPVPFSQSQRPADKAPAARPAPAPAAVRVSQAKLVRGRVFGVLDTDSLVHGTVICPCNPDKPVEIPYRNSDIAVGQVYCPRCSRAVSIGETLDRAKDLSTAVPAVEVAAPQHRPASWWRSVPGMVAALLVLGATITGVVWMWRDAPLVASVLINLGLSERPLIDDGPAAKKLTIPLSPAEFAKLGLIMAAGPLGPVPAAAALHPDLMRRVAESPESKITLAAVKALLEEKDVQEALIIAQVWKQLLEDRGVAATEARVVALAEVIPELQNRLYPQPPAAPPTVVADFRKLLGDIRTAIQQEQFPPAKKAIDAADALLGKHPQELAPFGDSFYLLKRRYSEIEREKNGIARINKLLDQAEEFARKAAGTQALEHEAKAKFLARRTPMSKEDGDRLDKRVRDLAPELQFARGQQAVEELRQCLKDGDEATRDKLALEANTHLPGLSDSKVGGLLAEVRKAAVAAVQPGKDSALGKAVAFRLLYEQALESYAVDDGPKLLAKAAEAANLGSAEDREKLAALIFEFLDQLGGDTLPLDDPQDLPDRFGKLRALLDQAGPWKSDPRWTALDAPLRRRGDQVARKAIDDARKLAAKDQLAEARLKLKPAELLGDKVTVKQAQNLDQQWEQEIKARADRAVQDQHWQRVKELHKEKKILEAWSELSRFSKRYPKAAGQQEVIDLEAAVRPPALALVAAKFRELDGLRDKKKWRDFMRGYELLMPLPLAGSDAAKLQEYGRQVEQNKRNVNGRFFEIAKRNGPMVNKEQVVILLVELPGILELAPDHLEAGALLEEARRKGPRYAKTELLYLPANPKRAAERLREIEILDGNGPIAAEARAVYKRMTSSK